MAMFRKAKESVVADELMSYTWCLRWPTFSLGKMEAHTRLLRSSVLQQ